MSRTPHLHHSCMIVCLVYSRLQFYHTHAVLSVTLTLISFYSAPQCSHCKRCTSYGNSVCMSVRPSVTRRYCVKTTARCTVHFALSDSKMCLVLKKPKKYFHAGTTHSPWNLGSNWPPPYSSESWHVLPCSVSTVKASEKSSIMTNMKSYAGFPTSHQGMFYAAPNCLKMGINYLNLLYFGQFR